MEGIIVGDKKEKITKGMREDLRNKFPDKAYSQHPTKTFLTTLKAMYVTERLNDVFGLGRWSIKHKVIERTEDYVLIRGKFISLDYDVVIPSQYGGHKTSGKNTEIADGYKSAITDCISKIASYLEIGIDMFKGEVNPPKSSGGNNKQNDDKPWLNVGSKEWEGALTKKSPIEDLRKYFKISKANAEQYSKDLLK